MADDGLAGASSTYGSMRVHYVNGATAVSASADEPTAPTAFGAARVASSMRVGVCLGLILAPAALTVGALRQRSRFVVRSAAPATLRERATASASSSTAAAEPALSDDMVTETWFHNFGKWTLTAASRDAAASNARAAWFGLNQIVLERNASVPDDHYEHVGPTGCAKVARAWTAERYLVGDNQIHWVWNGAPNATGEDEISVAEQHEFVRALHGDLSEFDQFMDTMYTSYVPRIDPYVELARQLKVRHGWEYKFVQGRSADEDVPVWSVLVANADGQIFELVSARLENVTNAAAFVADDCWFRPLGSFPDAPYFTDFEAEAVDLSKLGSFINAQPPRHAQMPFSAPSHTSIASTDPDADAEFLLKYLGGANVATLMNTTQREAERRGAATDVTHLEAARGVTGDRCARYKSRWLMFNGDGFEHFFHLSHHPEAKTGVLRGREFGLSEWEQHLASVRMGMNENVYDLFMDDHVGMDAWSDSRQDNSLFARMALQLHRDGEPILTRREPFPGDPAVYRTQSIEKFSFFFKLPVSQWPFQIQLPETTMDMLNDMGLPTFCDWDFCPEWGNYRDDGPKLTSPSQCGFADPTQR